MKKNLLILTVLGTVLPNYFVIKESIESGNIMLYRDIPQTFEMMFINNASSAFTVDLLFVVFLFFIWSFRQTKGLNRNKMWISWLFTMFLGLSGGLPFFLYLYADQKFVKET